MSKSNIFFLVTLAVFAACKSTSTNPLDGQTLRLITSDQDTTSVFGGQVTFTVTVLQPSGYGASGAYIDFYDPIEKRARHEGPTPEDGEWQITDSVASSYTGGIFEFAFVAESSGALSSDSLKLWVHEIGIEAWTIDSIWANSWDFEDIGVKWIRPSVDTGTDTVFVSAQGQGPFPEYFAPYPQNTAEVPASEGVADTITVHNAVASSRSVVWVPATYYGYEISGHSPITMYELADSANFVNTGLDLSDEDALPVNYSYDYRSYVDLILATDPNNTASGVTIISPSLTALSGFSGGRTTAFYHPVQYIDSGTNLHELYFSNDLGVYVNGVAPMYEIPLPDSSQYSTAFIAITENGNYALVSVGPVMHTENNYHFVYLAESYQDAANHPYAGRGRKR